jgi:hypothetical protein
MLQGKVANWRPAMLSDHSPVSNLSATYQAEFAASASEGPAEPIRPQRPGAFLSGRPLIGLVTVAPGWAWPRAWHAVPGEL